MIESIKDALVERIIGIMRLGNSSPKPIAVIDHKHGRILVVGDGPPETHVLLESVLMHPSQYAAIPNREQIETVGLIRDFIIRHFSAQESIRGAAIEALNSASSASEWRGALGEMHEAVIAFDGYMSEFRLMIARMLIHETHIKIHQCN